MESPPCHSLSAVNSAYLFGLPISNVTMEELLQVITWRIHKRQKTMLGMLNAAKIVKMHQDDALRQSVLRSDLLLADGASLVMASKRQSTPLKTRVAGIDIMMRLFAYAHQHSLSVYLLGASENVNQACCERLLREYPNCKLAGYHHGYFDKASPWHIVNDINRSGADILFVGMTTPYKEHFMAEFKDTLTPPLIHGVGGSFDVYAGKVKRAPLIWQRFGLEWFYRVCQEPRRMFMRYLTTNTRFLFMMMNERRINLNSKAKS